MACDWILGGGKGTNPAQDVFRPATTEEAGSDACVSSLKETVNPEHSFEGTNIVDKGSTEQPFYVGNGRDLELGGSWRRTGME